LNKLTARRIVRNNAAAIISALDLAQLIGEGEDEENTLKEKDEDILEKAQHWLVRKIQEINVEETA
jgi:hypothetical protein